MTLVLGPDDALVPSPWEAYGLWKTPMKTRDVTEGTPPHSERPTRCPSGPTAGAIFEDRTAAAGSPAEPHSAVAKSCEPLRIAVILSCDQNA